MRAILFLVLCGSAAAGDPKRSASEYPAHGAARHATVGAEYLGRTVPAAGESIYTPVHLVVEVAFYPEKGLTLPLRAGDFSLRLNGAKMHLAAQTPGSVAWSIVNEQYENPRGVVIGGGVGPLDIIHGAPRTTGRFPGDPSARVPRTPRAPADTDKPAAPSLAETLQQAALPESPASGAAAGLVFFAWKGKTKSLKTIDLIYDGPAGKLSLRLK